MDNAIWIVTIIAHVAILTIIICRRIYLPYFAFTILVGLCESPVLYQVRTSGSSHDYFLAYYACDLINIGVYVLSILETRRLYKFNIIAFSMSVYLVPKAFIYVALLTGDSHVANVAHGALRLANIACVATWSWLFAMYSELAPHMQSDLQLGATMESVEQEVPVTESEPETPVHNEEPKPEHIEPDYDPGAPPPNG